MENNDNNCALGLNVDMLDVDRLRDWARLIDVHGDHISDWGDPVFVASKLRDIADRLADEVRDVLQLRSLVGSGNQSASAEPAATTHRSAAP